MDLNKLSIEARTRNQWEAIDLGILLGKRLWRPLFVSWAIPVFTTYLILVLVFSISSLWPYFIIWWLKPLWDRLPLYIASRALFGEDVSAKDALRNILPIYKLDILPWITYRRFSFTRSLSMPVTVLEGLKSEARQKRMLTITRTDTDSASWLTIICLHVEQFIALAVFSFVIMLVPSEFQWNFLSLIVDEQELSAFALSFISLLTMCLVAPFYTAAGFCLYINRRIHLEAWDVEIRFRHLAGQHTINDKEETVRKNSSPNTTSLSSALLLCLALAFSGFSAEQVHAKDIAETKPVLVGSPKEKIHQILNGEEFHQMETTGSWKLKEADEKDPDKVPDWFIAFIEWLEEVFKSDDTETDEDDNFSWSGLLTLANIIEFLIWAAVISIIGYLLYQFRDHLPSFRSPEKIPDENEPPKVLFGLDVRKENLPDDIPTEVLALWKKDDQRGALSLLYRATLARLMHSHNVKFRESYTEGECLRVAKEHIEQGTYDYLADITYCWQNLAYGHISPQPNLIIDLCNRWGGVFDHEE